MKTIMSILMSLFFTLPSFANTDENKSKGLEIKISEDSMQSQEHINSSFNFGNVPIGQSRWANFRLTNTGYGNIAVFNIYVSGGGFYAWGSCPYWLYPGQSCYTRVEFRPWYQGGHSGQLTYSTSAGNYYVYLYGWGYYW